MADSPRGDNGRTFTENGTPARKPGDGDGRPKAVRFQDPSNPEANTVIESVKTVTREKLELKLASGLTAPARLRGLADVQELIRAVELDAAFAERLDGSVRAKYLELLEPIEKERGIQR